VKRYERNGGQSSRLVLVVRVLLYLDKRIGPHTVSSNAEKRGTNCRASRTRRPSRRVRNSSYRLYGVDLWLVGSGLGRIKPRLGMLLLLLYLPTYLQVQYSTLKTSPRTRVGEMNLSSYAAEHHRMALRMICFFEDYERAGAPCSDNSMPIAGTPGAPGAPDYHALG
jgi:hypothetical protein